MQTTGTVLLNARGVNINGYDCFVNLSKDTKNEVTHAVGASASYDANLPDPKYIKVDSTHTKYSSQSMHINNWISAYIRNTAFENDNSENVTVSIWVYPTVLESCYSSMSNYEGRGSFNGIYQVNCGFNMKSDSKTDPTVDQVLIWKGSWWTDFTHNAKYMNKWNHYAFTRYNGTSRIFINGTKVAELSGTSGVYTNNFSWRIYYGSHWFDDMVVIANQALWTSNFAPPSTYLLDSEYAINVSDVKRRNIIASNVDRKLIVPDEPLKQY